MKRLLLALACLGCEAPPETRLEEHLADLAAQPLDGATWEATGWRRAVELAAARDLQCATALDVERRGETILVAGCGGGSYVEVRFVEDAPRPLGVARATRTTHLFVDVAREEAPAKFARWAARLAASQDDYFFLGSSAYSAQGIAGVLRQLAQRNAAGAEALSCPRAEVGLDTISSRGLALQLAEGCGRRATFADGRLISVVRDGKLAQF